MVTLSELPPHVAKIVRTTSVEYGVRPDEILGTDTSRDIAFARHVVWWRWRNVPRPAASPRAQVAYTRIAKAFGKDYNTVRNGVLNIEAIMTGVPRPPRSDKRGYSARPR